MKKLWLVFSVVLLAFSGRALAQFSEGNSMSQFDSYKNSVYVELGGNGFIGSLNYERLLPLSEAFTVTARVGGFYLRDGKKNYGYMLPAEVSLLCGRNSRKFEAGFGYTYFKYEDRDFSYYDGVSGTTSKMIPILRLGARRQLGESPFFLRSAFTFLFIESVTLGKFPIPWIGISAGYSFGEK